MGYIDAEKVFYRMDDGREVCLTETALSILLKEDVLFANSRKYLDDDYRTGNPGTTIQPETIVLFVKCNDLFWWATADSETLTLKEVGELYKMWFADKKWGSDKWCCKKRKMQPQEPIRDDMKKNGAWEPWMDELQDPGES